MEWYWLIFDGTESVKAGTGLYMMVLGQYRSVLVDTWWYWVSMEWYWLIYDGTGSVWGDTWLYFVVLDQYRAVLVGNLWYCVSIGGHWLVIGGGTVSLKGCYACI